MEHLTANSGLQFITSEMTLNPSQGPEIENGKTLGYYVIVKNEYDDITGSEDIFFDFLCQTNQTLVPLRELLHPQMGYEIELELNPGGGIIYTKSGLPIIRQDANLAQYKTIQLSELNKKEIIRFSSLDGSMIAPDPKSNEMVPAYEMFIDKWLPVPMFEERLDGSSQDGPTGWCRLKMQSVRETAKGERTFRMIWAFDTDLGETGNTVRPTFEIYGSNAKKYSFCNIAESLLGFISTEELEGGRALTPVADYILGLFNNRII